MDDGFHIFDALDVACEAAAWELLPSLLGQLHQGWKPPQISQRGGGLGPVAADVPPVEDGGPPGPPPPPPPPPSSLEDELDEDDEESPSDESETDPPSSSSPPERPAEIGTSVSGTAKDCSIAAKGAREAALSKVACPAAVCSAAACVTALRIHL